MFKKNFEKYCAEIGESPSSIVQKIGLSNSAYSQWSETSVPRRTTLIKLADYLGVTVGDLLRDEDDAETPNLVNIDKIKSLAKDQGIKIKFICAQLSLAEGYLSNVQSGKTVMTEERLEKIADILHTTPEYLRDETDIKEKPSAKGEELSVNTVIMRSRDGSIIKRRLSDEQVRALQTIIGQLPDAPDDL